MTTASGKEVTCMEHAAHIGGGGGGSYTGLLHHHMCATHTH